MTVKELIEFLQTQPQDIRVIYCCYSEYDLMKEEDILIVEACEPRTDGWIQSKRPDMPSQSYLRFPGN